MRTNRRHFLGGAVGGIEDACRGIDTESSLAKAWARMTEAGRKRIPSGELQV